MEQPNCSKGQGSLIRYLINIHEAFGLVSTTTELIYVCIKHMWSGVQWGHTTWEAEDGRSLRLAR